MITVTESAQAKIDDILAEENDTKCRLRIFVQGGGCSGFTYGFTLDKDINEDDFEFPAGKTNLIVDSMSLQYLNEAIIDYKDDIYGSSFTIKNPNATTTCGCGSSFSI